MQQLIIYVGLSMSGLLEIRWNNELPIKYVRLKIRFFDSPPLT